jgi:hypothetical protein
LTTSSERHPRHVLTPYRVTSEQVGSFVRAGGGR